MELISSQIDKIEDMLAKLDEVIDLARGVPFSNKVSVEKDALYSVIDDIRGTVYDMRKGLPSEMNQARRVMHDRDNIVSDAKHRAEMTIKAAEEAAEKMINDHDITIQAKTLAAQIEEEAKQKAEEFKVSAANFIIEIFDDLDHLVDKTLQEQIEKAREIESFYDDVLTDIHNSRNSIKGRL